MKVVACYYDTHLFFWFIFKNRNQETEPLWGQTHIRNGSTRIPYPINTVYNNFIVYSECKTPSDKKLEFFLNLLHVNVTYHVCLNV